VSSQHGQSTIITVAAKDISSYTMSSKLTRSANIHGFTGYGKTAEQNRGGLVKFTFTAEGWYDNTQTTGTHAVLNGQEGVTQAITRKPEGTGTGKPLQSFSAVLQEYVETNPANDIVTWSATWTGHDVITDSTQ
jgi:hypothetical protein